MFKVNHLAPCFVDADRDDVNLRESSFQPEEIDARELLDAKLSNFELMALNLDREYQRKNGNNRQN